MSVENWGTIETGGGRKDLPSTAQPGSVCSSNHPVAPRWWGWGWGDCLTAQVPRVTSKPYPPGRKFLKPAIELHCDWSGLHGSWCKPSPPLGGHSARPWSPRGPRNPIHYTGCQVPGETMGTPSQAVTGDLGVSTARRHPDSVLRGNL